MDQSSHHLQLLEQRISSMQALGKTLELTQAAVAQRDLSVLEQQTRRQREICQSLRANAENLAGSLKPAAGEEAGSEFASRRRMLREQLAAVENHIRELNRSYAALLRRAKRTIDIFCRLLASSEQTYAVPAALKTAGASGRK